MPSSPPAGTPGQNQVLVSVPPDGADGIHGAATVANDAGHGSRRLAVDEPDGGEPDDGHGEHGQAAQDHGDP